MAPSGWKLWVIGFVLLLPPDVLAGDGRSQVVSDRSAKYRLTVVTDPIDADVKILNVSEPYSPTMLLANGRYHVKVSHPNYLTEQGFIDLAGQDWTGKVVLKPKATTAELLRSEKTIVKNFQKAAGTALRSTDKDRGLGQEWAALVRERQKLEEERQRQLQEQNRLELAQLEIAKAWLEINENRSRIMGETADSIAVKHGARKRVTTEPVVGAPPALLQEIAQEETLVQSASSSPKPHGKAAVSRPVSHADRTTMRATTAKTAVGTHKKHEKATQLLTEAMRYLKRARGTGDHPLTPAKEVLQEALQLAPNDPRILDALSFLKKRYMVYAGLSAENSQAVKMEKRIQALGLPVFRQAVSVKGKPFIRVCSGLFKQRDQAVKALKRIEKSFGIHDAILRQYSD